MEDTPTEEPESSSPVVRVLQKTLHYTKQALRYAFYPFLVALLASLVANEMIIYPAPVRLIFFIFTFFLCFFIPPVLILISVFYLCKWGFNYYVNVMSDGPKRLIMPTLFAFLPLTTKKYENSLINVLARPFQYGEEWSVTDGKELEQRMELYQNALNDAFPYLESIKNTEPFDSQLKKIETRFHDLHRIFNPNQSANNLPPTIKTVPNQSVPNQSATNQSVPNQSTTNQSVSNQSVPNQSATNQSVPNQSVPNQSVPNQSVPNQSVPNQSVPNQSANNKSANNLPPTIKTVPNQSTTNQSAPNQSTTNQSAPNQSANNQSTTNQSPISKEAPKESAPLPATV